ncbi:hypothetical protein IQ07DRAFT_596549 [Pyrenochaeta sp. DS3sAY3a]|nr:hypothetical protein IQ07DRAFT_596549 [Pyrenochaeta sp. DS3sAY3a]
MTGSSSLVVTGGTSHQLRLRIESTGYTGPVFAADDFYVIAASGPDNNPVCNPTPAPAPSCFSAPSGNVVRNPDFNFDTTLNSALAYWSVTQGPAFSSASGVRGDAGYPSGNGFVGTTVSGAAGAVDSTLVLSQDGLAIPEGAVIDVRAQVNPRRSMSTTAAPWSLTLKFDTQVVRNASPTTSNVWVTFGTTISGKITVTGSGPHTISLEARTTGVANADIFFADGFLVEVLGGPGGQRVCNTSS